MVIHQFVHTLSYGDAISAEVLSLQACFKKRGFASEIYAINIHPRLVGRAHDYRDFRVEQGSQLIMHYSLGSPLNELYLQLNGVQRTLIYHNLTPPEWFMGVNPRVVTDLERGRSELPILCEASDRLIADSEFNANELRVHGFEVEVLPLPIDPERWSVESNPGITQLLRDDPGIHLLHVGRMVPNKCLEDIIRVFYFIHHHIERRSKLWLVGIDTDTELYSFGVRRLVHELLLSNAVNFTGCLDDSEVRALYENCTAYICMSEHEGFCLPVVEAMHFGLPVIAYASSALPDTIGTGGILVHEKRHPEIAELVNEVHLKPEFADSLAAAGHKRVTELGMETFNHNLDRIFSLGSWRSSAKAIAI